VLHRCGYEQVPYTRFENNPSGGMVQLNALILLSHGSRRRESNDEMLDLTRAVSDADGSSFDHVTCAFQQFARPTLDDAVDDLVGLGATTVVVFPLFLAAGSHVRDDVPAMVRRVGRKHPDVTIRVAPHLGRIAALAPLLLKEAIRHI
jgi:sirohydrochlorin ferrochelatase